MIDTVIFDIGNVFVEWDPRRLYEKLIPDPLELNFFLSTVVTMDWHAEHDRGRPFAEGVAQLSKRYPEYAELIEHFDTRWEETIGPVIDSSVDILEQLVDKGITCYALTNFSAEKFPAFKRDYAFTSLFAGIVVSGEEKLIKPDPRIFQLIISRYQLDPEKTLFIDDRMENVKAAEQLNITGHVYRDAYSLRTHMTALGLL